MTLLLTWTDRTGPTSLGHHAPSGGRDPGPVIRLLEQPESRGRYSAAVVVTTPFAAAGAACMAAEMRAHVGRVEVTSVDVTDPSDHEQLFAALGPLVHGLPRDGDIDVVLSAGTPQVQTLWVILVKSGLLRARMLKVVPPAFVPHPHPRPVVEVRLDFEGFPEIRALRDEVHRLRAEASVRRGLLGRSEPMERLRRLVARLAPTDVPVLVHGETGTGKELVARALHEAGGRRPGPFVAENCGALSEGVLASELFGHEKGAFTGAGQRRRGLFEQAHGGTLFLDEVAELPPRVQVMLLRVLQEGEVRRVGGERAVPVDVRIVAATHRDLGAMVREGRFREDLWYRLRGATLEVPPLRERSGDLRLLVEHFLAEAGALHLAPTLGAYRALQAYGWPGNIRELRGEVVRWSVFCESVVDLADLSPEIVAGPGAAPRHAEPGPHLRAAGPTLAEAVAQAEREAVQAAFARHGGNKSRTARALGIDRNTLKRKLAQYDIDA